MEKIDLSFIKAQYESGTEAYFQTSKEVGLWASEKHVFQQHLKPTDHILDLGCGTGRTTFALFKMGYTHIRGVDLTPGMITSANQLNEHFGLAIPFAVGDACKLGFENSRFDAVIFSFNGLMSIPGRENRVKALEEIHRVLIPGGVFLFTTHDRDSEPAYLSFWEEQRQLWEEGKQDERLFEFGDLITTSKNETAPIFIHIPDRPEIEAFVGASGFKLVETFYRSERFDESPEVKAVSGECRFWVVRKG